MSKDYGSWSIVDLKNELKKRNAKVTGKKTVLVERLKDYDKRFGPLVTEPDSVFKIVVPNPKNFHEVTSDSLIPALQEEDILTFCNMTGRENISSSNNMYKEFFLLSWRIAHADGEYFICGLCASKMRKNISYNVTVKVKYNQIVETQCECAAGMGPYAHCKHILVLLFGIIDFNKTIKTKSSCSSNLQTFHHPAARYSGNIVEASKIKLKLKNQIAERMTTFDPRKANIDAKFQENFNNLIGNFTGGNMPIRHKLKPADKKSMYTKSSCTSNLQTFHHPAARYSGNIVEASKIKLKLKNQIAERMTTFDPRKANIDAKFQENFNNLIGNFTGGNMPIRHKLKPADKKSMYSDHDYLEKTVEEIFF